MIAISTNVILNLLQEDQQEIDQIIAARKGQVIDFNDNPRWKPPKKDFEEIELTKRQSLYVNYLIEHFEEVVKVRPEEIGRFKRNFSILISAKDMKHQQNRLFRNELLRRMGYAELRENHYPDYFSRLHINACVYCNSQLAVSVKSHGNRRIAKFQVDHFYPKAEYPCFSISYFNLYPACSSCNARKSAKPLIFDLYSDDPAKLKQSAFRFNLDTKSIIKYKLRGHKDELEINFTGAESAKFNTTFDITGIYSTQKDLAEELVIKSMIYDRAYLSSLRESFRKLYPLKTPMVNRLITGNYTDERDLHKRPMSKFTHDIARQLKLISQD